MPAAIAKQDQADADGDLGRGDREHHDRQHDRRQAVRPRAARAVAPEGDQIDVGGVEHDLDGHQHRDGVAAHQHARQSPIANEAAAK